MRKATSIYYYRAIYMLLLLCAFSWTGCNVTKTVPEGKYLLRSNTIKLKSDKLVTRTGELRDDLDRLIVQKPNYYTGIPFIHIPTKLILYNLNPSKYEKNTENFQLKSKTVERPVIFDSSTLEKSRQTLQAYLVNQGYFYAKVRDTVRFKKKKAYVTYYVNTGTSYVINNVDFTTGITDSTIRSLVQQEMNSTTLAKGVPFTFSLFEEERSRITTVLRNNGYYYFTQDNISFVMDTVKKSFFKDADNLIEGAINFLATQQKKKKPTCDIQVNITPGDDPNSFKRYGISKVEIYPDYTGRWDLEDSDMITKNVSGLVIKYHDYYVREKVILKHTFLFPETWYSQNDYDNTIAKLSELGIFQYVRVSFRPDSTRENFLTCRIEMNRNKKYYLAPSIEVSNGSTYALGSALTLTYRDINFAKGANLLTLSVNGGIEMPYYDSIGNNFFEHFQVLTRNFGLNGSIDFPKFIVPFKFNRFSNRNLPHTVISAGTNYQERINYFTMINNNAAFTYTWKESSTKSWTLSPAFVNIVHFPSISPTFQERLDTNEFLRNSYKETFIEGENISFTFSDQAKRGGRNYNYLRTSAEEAGALLTAITGPDSSHSQYVKFDFDAQHVFSFKHSKVATRFIGGVGIPYGQSPTLPYIKQYYVGGPYSLRGWRVRTLGPGSSVDTTGSIYVDRTGDIKLELNGEFRFDIARLFAGFIKFDGAMFADAGNIWLANKSDNYPGGEFDFSTLGHTIATDVGLGARFEIATFIVFRIDAAFPIKKPYVAANNGWVIKEVDFSNPSWRANNLVINLALGYPF